MGWITDFFKGHKKKENQTYAKMLDGTTPVFSQFGQDIYASDVVQQAVLCIVMELKKLTPQHVRKAGANEIPVDSELQRILDNPNPIMTQSDLIEKIFWQLFLNYNSFVIPTYETTKGIHGEKIKKYTGLWPIQPIQVDFLQDTSEELYIKFTFSNGYTTTLKRSDVIHLKYRFSVNELMGGNSAGQPDNAALLKILQLNNTLLEGTGKALKSSFAINGVIKYNTLLDDGVMEKNIADLEKKLRANESGFLGLDINGEFIPINRQIALVDDATLKFIDEKILRQFGVSLPILTGDYTKAQYEAFYQKTLEPLIISISQEFTKILFTGRERGFGNKIIFYPHELIFMDTAQKLEMIRLLGDSGALYENEKRIAFGLKPLAELDGVRMQSLNYVDVQNAATYQVGEQSAESNDAINGDELNG
ncbi:MAG TPA: phage portal protein [Firmicutes bacterium]|nr:phage portal protein [Bacillota bacterium]